VTVGGLAVGAALASAVVALGLPVSSTASRELPIASPSRASGATIAKIVISTAVYNWPVDGKIVWRARTQTLWGHDPHWLLVLDSWDDEVGRQWLEVLLPVRPNGATGWIRRDHVLLAHSPFWIALSTERRLVSVYRAGRLVRRFPAVVGAASTPTPHGLFAIYDEIPQAPPNGFLGPWALHLTAFSEVLEDYGGGPGRVAMHGRDGTSLRDPLGTARSHGCIRIENRHVVWLARVVPNGTPVSIRA
jgi:L,D-transpeptidase-like protein